MHKYKNTIFIVPFLVPETSAGQDIINSEMGYMGFDDSESYGLSWKVRGFCVDL